MDAGEEIGEELHMLNPENIPVIVTKEKSGNGRFEPVHLENALTMTGHGKFHHFLLLVSGLSLMGMMFEMYITSYLLPSAQCDFDMTSEQKGLLNSISYIGIIASCHMWGFIADTKGRKKALTFSLGLDFLCAVISSFAPEYYSFLVIRFFNGFFVFCAGSVVFAFTGEFHGPKTRERAVMLLSAFLAGAALVLPALAWLIIPQKWSFELPTYTYTSWRFFVLILGLPSLFSCLIIYFFVPESPKFLLAQGRHDEALKVLQHIYSVNTGKTADSYQVEVITAEIPHDKNNEMTNSTKNSVWNVILTIWEQTVPLFRKPHLPYTCLVCVLQFGIFMCFNSLLLWLPEVFNRMAEFRMNYPSQSATVCESLTLKLNINASVIAREMSNNISDATVVYWNTSESTVTDEMEEALSCNTNITLDTYLNNIIIGTLCVTVNVASGYIVRFGRNIFIFSFSILTASCALALYFVTSSEVVLALAAIFVAFNGCSSGFVTAVVIDIFPTTYRAMAMCLSLMSGRLGVVVGSMIIGALIEASCDAVFFSMSAIMFICAGLSCLLPKSRRTTESSKHTT